jgi:hypothetical protein
MRSKWLTKGAFAALVFGVLAAGCIAEADPINRVQANAVPKTFFVGQNLEDFHDDPEFRAKSFNVDSASNTDNFVGSVGIGSALERVRWEVTENWLLARRSYQEAPGADNRGLPRVEVSPGKWEFSTPPTGTIVAAYRITRHFDIRRSYNPATGEEANTIEENMDRPWQQREYMRVDWSRNQAKSTSGDTSWVFGEGGSLDSLEYNESNESVSEDRPHFETDAGYFDVTNKYSISPEPLPGFGIPECALVGFITGSTSWDCTPTQVKVRHSFVKLTGNEDFEPFEESKAFLDIVGNWGNAGNSFNREYGGAPRTSWDPQYGFTDTNTKTFYSIHNIWEKSHQNTKCGSNLDEDKDGTADECAQSITKYTGVAGSQCDVNVGKCTIPVRDRKVKTIAYSLNAEAPQEWTDEVDAKGNLVKMGPYEELTETWNQFMKVSVATRREIECRRTGEGSREDCHAKYFEGSGPETKQMVKFGGWGIDTPTPQTIDQDKTTQKDTPLVATCHNPVRSYDLSVCGKAGDTIRLGDVRRNYTIYWPYHSRAPYGGVATIGGDPITGEMAGVTATTMLWATGYTAAMERDIISLAIGDITLEELTDGVPATRYADRVKDGKLMDAMMQPKSAAELTRAVQSVDLSSIQTAVGESPTKLAQMPRVERQLKAAFVRANSSPNGVGVAVADERLKGLMSRLDSFEGMHEVTNRNLKRLAAESANRNTNVYQAIDAMASKDPAKIEELLQQYQAYLGNRGICYQDPVNAKPSFSLFMSTLGPYFKQRYGSLDPKERGMAIYKDLSREAFKATSIHEIGHSLGLRHNFSSSWDAMNYPPQYWQLRTNEGKATTSCASGADPATCIGPRYVDPITADEAGIGSEPRPGIDYFANTSAMEYQIENSGGDIGVGTYDLHAMKVLYGQSIETFDSSQVSPAEQQNFALKTLSQGIAKDLVFDQAKGYGSHYTKTAMRAKVFDPKRDCRDATEEEKEIGKWNIVHGKICSQAPKNHLAYQDMETSALSMNGLGQQNIPIGANGVRWKGVDETGKTLVRWPYRYGEDYGSTGFLHAKPFDSGADIYEVTKNAITSFENGYWRYFRRQNREFAWWAYGYGAGFSRIRNFHWTATTDIGRASAEELADDDFERPSVVASQEMFSFLQRVLLMPEPGTYGLGAETDKRTPSRANAATIYDLFDSNSQVPTTIGTLGIVDGRFVQVDFDNNKGGSWDYNNFPMHASFDEEKALAFRELVDARPTLSLISRETALDGRDPYISFRTDVPQGVDRLIGGLLSEDWEAIAPSMNADGITHTPLNLAEKNPADIARPAGFKGIIFPNIGYMNELNSGIYGLLFSRFSTDMVLAQKMRIRYDGDNVPVLPTDRTTAFVDPITGHRYLAARYGTETIGGRPVERGIASRMLIRANELLGDAYENVGAADATGERLTQVGADGLPVVKNAAAEKNLRRYIGLLDGMRQVGRLLGGGPIGYGDGD